MAGKSCKRCSVHAKPFGKTIGAPEIGIAFLTRLVTISRVEEIYSD
jgi:hypothetical protein